MDSISIPTCGGPGGGVTSVNGQTGAVTGAQAVAGADIAPNSITTGHFRTPGAAATGTMRFEDSVGNVRGSLDMAAQVWFGYGFQPLGTSMVLSGGGLGLDQRGIIWRTSGAYGSPDINLSPTASSTLALGNGTTGDASGTLHLANLTASGTLSGRRVSRDISTNYTVVVSGNTPDRVLYVDSTAGIVTVTIPPLSLPAGMEYALTVIDAGNHAAGNHIVVSVYDTGTTYTLSVNGGRMDISVSGTNSFAHTANPA